MARAIPRAPESSRASRSRSRTSVRGPGKASA